jgi:hypothetical protein
LSARARTRRVCDGEDKTSMVVRTRTPVSPGRKDPASGSSDPEVSKLAAFVVLGQRNNWGKTGSAESLGLHDVGALTSRCKRIPSNPSRMSWKRHSSTFGIMPVVVKRNKKKRSRKGSAAGEARAGGAVDGGRGKLHFTVGSLPRSGGGPKGGFFDFERELDLLKAALLYADRVRMCSVGASFMSGLDDLSNMSLDGKLAVIRKYLPVVEPGATPEQLERTYELMESVKGARGGSGRRGFSPQARLAARQLINQGWSRIEGRVRQEYRGVGAEGFREALRTRLVELHPFAHISAEKILDMGMAADQGLGDVIDSDEIYDEYLDGVLDAVGNGGTYPLFDDLTGDIVGEAVRNGIILPSEGAVARGKHGGLSGGLLRRLPLFERATIPEVLDVREELAEHLSAFREAVAGYAEAIGPASWSEGFAEEADRVFREKVAPAVDRIERAVENNRDLRELTYRFGPPMVAGGSIPSISAFVGTGSVLTSVALLAAGLTVGAYQGAAAHRIKRKELEGNQLYFYYRAGTELTGPKGNRRMGRA